jgi:hypothetical protein
MMEAKHPAWSLMRSPSNPVSSPFISPISFISGQMLGFSSCTLSDHARVKCEVHMVRLMGRAFHILNLRKDLVYHMCIACSMDSLIRRHRPVALHHRKRLTGTPNTGKRATHDSLVSACRVDGMLVWQ